MVYHLNMKFFKDTDIANRINKDLLNPFNKIYRIL